MERERATCCHAFPGKAELERLVGIAEEDEMSPLVKKGDSGFYAVFDGRNRLLEPNWAPSSTSIPSRHHDPGNNINMTKVGQRLICKVWNIPSSSLHAWVGSTITSLMKAELKPTAIRISSIDVLAIVRKIKWLENDIHDPNHVVSGVCIQVHVHYFTI